MVKQFLKERLGTIILLVIVVVFVLWGFIRVDEAKDNAITFNDKEYVEPEGNVDFENPGEYVSIAKTDALELFYNEARGAIQVKDLKSGYLWKGVVDEEVYSFNKVNKQWVAYMQSAVTVTYNDMKKRDSGAKTARSAVDAKWMESKYIENGVSVTYGFTTPGIYVTVEYRLEDDQFVVRIPYTEIREDTKFAVQTIEVLPYFGAAGNEVSGYLFYPDGSGAITCYEKVDSRPSSVKYAPFYTYTNRSVTFRNMWDEEAYNRYTSAMPVFGIKNNDNALFATMSEGAENSAVNVYPSGVVVDLNHASFEVYVRNVYSVNMNSMSTADGGKALGALIQRLDKNVIPEDKEIRYFFLSGEDADYSGMATVYREYLKENGMLNDAITDGDKMPLALNLLMGTTKDGIVFDEYITMTDFEQTQEILQRLQEAGITDSEVVLQAWMKDYDNYEYWAPARQLGGKSGLKDLNDYLETVSGSNVYLESGFMFATSETNDFNEDTDVAYDGLDLEVSLENMDGLMLYMTNPLAAYKRNNDFLEKLQDYNLFGVAYDDVGKYVYADFNANATFTKSESVQQLKELLAASENTGRNVALAGANQYIYSHADYLYGLREDCYGLSITDYAVPFVQLVLSGSIPYSTEGAGNLSYDLQVQKLKWIEYGALPYFYLTYESALNLRDTGYDTLFSSTYSEWEETVVDTYKEFEQNLSVVYGQEITEHKIITDDLIRLEYANGVVIYINYSDADVTADDVTVPAKNYVVVRGGEQ